MGRVGCEPHDEALHMDAALSEKCPRLPCVQRARVMPSKNPVNPGKEMPVVAGRSVGNVGAWSSASRAFVVLSKLLLGRRGAVEQARARQRMRKHFRREEIMRNSGSAQLEVGQRAAAGRQGKKSCGAKLGLSDGLAFSHCHPNKARSRLRFKP